MTLYLNDRAKVYKYLWALLLLCSSSGWLFRLSSGTAAAAVGSSVCHLLFSGANSFAYFKIPSRRCFIFDTQKTPNTEPESMVPVARSRLSPVIARCSHCHAHTYYIFYAHIILHKHTRAHTLFYVTGYWWGNPWHHKGCDEVNRITYTNYHRHCAPAFKNIFLLILFVVTPQKFLLFQLR